MERTTSKRRINWRWLAPALAAAAAAGLAGGIGLSRAAPARTPAYLANFPNFAPRITAQLPGDVDIGLKKKLEAEKKFSQVQREFDLYSWQMFLALNWPSDNRGRPAPRITDTRFGAPYWTLWHNSASIFQADGQPPDACGLQAHERNLVLRRDLSKPVSHGLRPFSAQAAADDHRQTRFLGVISAVGELNAATLDDTKQAFSGPLIDQNGEFVFYEIMIDPNEVNYLCANNLYNINGQVAFAGAGGKVVMPIGAPDIDRSGAFELKLAWRILKPGKDDFRRYHTMKAHVIDQDAAGKPVERNDVTVGLVGMHIGHKSQTSQQWIWSTFEQVDNLDVDDVTHPNLSPSFFDPNCWICAVNQEPYKGTGAVYPRTPVQAWRAIGIPIDKQRLNAQAQAALARLGSVWQYYQLIDTQWPTDPSDPPPGWNSGLPGAVANKPGGDPTPVFLTNITMETYFQGQHVDPPGLQANSVNMTACTGEELPGNVNCPTGDPVQPPVWTSPLNNSPNPVKPGTNTLIFATESCMGCHSSAGIWTSYDPKTGTGAQSGQLSADFSWLLSQKAKYQGGAPPAAPLMRLRERRRR